MGGSYLSAFSDLGFLHMARMTRRGGTGARVALVAMPSWRAALQQSVSERISAPKPLRAGALSRTSPLLKCGGL